MALAAFINSPTGPMTTHFWGPIANWGLAASGMYDAALKGPEIINERMSATQILYSGLFVRFAWAVQPRNYILASCHTANVLAQGNQLRRWAEYKIQTEPETGPSTVRNASLLAAGAAAGIAAMLVASTPVQNSLKGCLGPSAVLVGSSCSGQRCFSCFGKQWGLHTAKNSNSRV
ncbi:MPC1 [Symbiodinium sp. CCMP2592]|nr:MPC1 [Symbiodinium sp. CCMP2592]